MPQDPASFRDPAGHVHFRGDRIYRTVLAPGTANYQAVAASGFTEEAIRSGRLIEGTAVDARLLQDEEPAAVYVIEHPRLDFISYPYEWSFFGLKAAALLTIDLHVDALARGVTLSDASAYNIQFIGPQPLFIDYLSLIPYQEGQVWLGYRQFCEQFLNPLLLTAKTGVAFQTWYRGNLEGIPASSLKPLLPFRAKLDPRVGLHVVLQGRMQQNVTSSTVSRAQKVKLSRTGLEANLRSMRSWVAGLEPPGSHQTAWQSYEQNANYTTDERSSKARFISETVARVSARTVWDLGCNSGEYSEIALGAGARCVIGFEYDTGALTAAFKRAVTKNLQLLPLWMDVANPSPSIGWQLQERRNLMDRRNADMVMCLALLHHLVLGRNLPLPQVLDWLISLAPHGVLEFVPKDDAMAKQLIALKPDIAPEYERSTVTELLRQRVRIDREEVVTESGRVLFAYSRA